MTIQCPYCQHGMSVGGAQPGRYRPRCRKCGQQFALAVHRDPARPPTVTALAPAVVDADPLDANLADVLGLDPDPVPARQAGARQTAVQRPMAAKATLVAEPGDSSISGSVAGGTMAGESTSGGSVAGESTAGATMPPVGDSHSAVSPTNVDLPPASVSRSVVQPQEQPPAPIDDSGMIRGNLGGYQIIQKLGGGGMGAVYLARQLSLDRNVAVKVLHPKFATDPQFVARFTREAFAAAQLTHHNVVQIYDIGARESTHYFSMEYVEGQTLGDVVRKEGKLDAEVAVGYILQAARGLKFAHDHGMIHRDVKPENLMLNDQGIVKVADLGLVKTPGSNETKMAREARDGGGSSNIMATEARTVMGTPAYMAPEQAEDSTAVDARADIYSLGCTLYDMLTGHPPFGGKTAVEVMTKHQREPAVPPHRVERHVPERLSAIVMKMLAKTPTERYASLADVIKDLEVYLGVESTGPFTPKEEHIRSLEVNVQNFQSSSFAKLRGNLIAAFFILCVLAIAGAGAMGSWVMAGGLVGFTILSAVSYFIVSGITQKTFLFAKTRELVFGAPIVDWFKWIFVGILAIAILIVLGLHWAWLGFAIAAVGVACAFHFTIDMLANRQRSKPIQHTLDMLRQMRMKGLEENAIRQFVCKYAGDRWEEFYEALFGYEAKIEARSRWGKGERGRPRKKFRAWRELVIAWIDSRVKFRQEERLRKHLLAVEVRSLQAKGMDELEARKKARRLADAVVERAAELKKQAATRAVPATVAPGTTSPNLVTSVTLETIPETRKGQPDWERQSYLQRKYGGPMGLLCGPQVRFLLGVILLIPFCLWLYQNKSVPVADVAGEAYRQAQRAHDRVAQESRHAAPETAADLTVKQPTRPLSLPMTPEFVDRIAGSYNAGVAGLLLLISAFMSGWRIGFVLIPAAAFILIGHMIPGVPTIAFVDRFIPESTRNFLHPTPLAAGSVVGVLAMVFLRER